MEFTAVIAKNGHLYLDYFTLEEHELEGCYGSAHLMSGIASAIYREKHPEHKATTVLVGKYEMRNGKLTKL